MSEKDDTILNKSCPECKKGRVYKYDPSWDVVHDYGSSPSEQGISIDCDSCPFHICINVDPDNKRKSDKFYDDLLVEMWNRCHE